MDLSEWGGQFVGTMTATAGGLVPTPPNDATKFLNGAGGFSKPLPPGWVSVADYGAVGNGTTSDTAAFLLARDTGANVFIPSGTVAAPKHYLVDSSIATMPGQVWKMAHDTTWVGQDTKTNSPVTNQIKSCILFANTTSYLFDTQSGHAHLEGIFARQHQSYIPTAGGLFLFGSRSSAQSYFHSGQNLTAHGGFNNFDFSGTVAAGTMNYTFFDNLRSANSGNSGFHINLYSTCGDLRITNAESILDNIGCYVRQTDTMRIMGLSIKTPYQRGLWLAADLGPIAQMNLIGLDIEDSISGSNQNLIDIAGGAAYDVTDCSITAMETYHDPAIIKTLNLGARAKRTLLVSPKLRGYRYNDAGVGNQIIGGTTHNYGTLAAGNAINLAGTDSVVSGHYALNYAVGLNLAAGANYAAISGNNFRSNTTAAVMDAAAKATGRGVGNIGLGDW